jgi:hypothetical protein
MLVAMRWFVVLGLMTACGGDAAAPDAEHYSGSGSIELRSYASEPGVGAGTTAQAMFIAREDCSTEQVGPCSIRGCQPEWLGLAVSAGSVTIDSTPAFSLDASADHASTFYRGNAKLAAFGAGDTRTLTATGSAVPAFSSTFVVPGAAVITSPNAPARITIGTDDLKIAWTGGSDFVDVILERTLARGRCRFPASDGAGTIPNVVLVEFHEPGAELLIVTSTDVTANVPDWTMTTTASIDATWPDGSAAVGTLSFPSP